MTAPQSPASDALRRETEQDYWTPEEHRADRERRIAWRVAVVLLIVAELTLVLFTLLDRTRVSLWLQLVRLIVLLPLAVFMWLDRKWARDTLLVLTILGAVVAVGILGPSFLAPIAILVTITGALLLILLGRPRRWRTIIGAALYSIILVPTLVLFLISALMLNVRQVSPEGARKLVEANQLLDAGDFNKARNLFREAVEENPNSVQGHFGLCQAYMQGRSFALALNSCNKAIELNPKYVDPRSYRTALLLQLRRYEEAEQSATDTLALDKRFSAFAMRAEARIGLGDTAGARADAEKALELATNDDQRVSAQALLEKLP